MNSLANKTSKTEEARATTASGFWQRHKTLIILLIIGFLGGVLWLVGLRFFLIKSPETHFHANFAVYIDGVREEFKPFTYYEEVAACTDAYGDNPKGRVHMHDRINDVIHVHDARVSYGNFFENIGWAVGENFISARDKLYAESGNKEVRFILNGEEVDNVADTLIKSTDRLLVSFGDTDTDFAKQFETVADTAAEVNGRPDPATCGGLNGAGHDSFMNRLRRASFWE